MFTLELLSASSSEFLPGDVLLVQAHELVALGDTVCEALALLVGDHGSVEVLEAAGDASGG